MKQNGGSGGVRTHDQGIIANLAKCIASEYKSLFHLDVNRQTIEKALLRYLEVCVSCNSAQD